MIKPFFRMTVFFIVAFSALCMATSVYIVDDFEDGEIERTPEWWTFGILDVSLVDNNKDEATFLGDKSLRLKGNPSEWYVGGMGTYLGIDSTPYNAIKLLVRGNGIESVFLRIELYDDDNNNWVL